MQSRLRSARQSGPGCPTPRGGRFTLVEHKRPARSACLFGICVTVLPALLLGAAQGWWRPELPVASLRAGWIKVIMLAGLVWMLLGVRPS